MRKCTTGSLLLALSLCMGMFTVSASALEVRTATPCIYDEVGDFSGGLAWVEKDGKRGFVDKTGQEVIPCIYDGAHDFNNGLALVRKGNKCGFVDKTGQEVIPCIYDSAHDFSNGLALVKKDNKRGFVDKAGQEVIPCIYDDAHDFSDGLALVNRGSKYSFIDQTGQQVFSIQRDYSYIGDFSDGLAVVSIEDPDSKTTFSVPGYTAPGITTPGVTTTISFNRGGYKYGYIDKTGKEIIPCEYYSASSFSNGLAKVSTAIDVALYNAVIDKSNKEITELSQFAEKLELDGFSDGFYACDYRYVDRDGKILDFNLSENKSVLSVNKFSEGVGTMKLIAKELWYGLTYYGDYEYYGFVDKTGHVKAGYRLTVLGNFSNGLAPAEIANEIETDSGSYRLERSWKWGYINKDLKIIVPAHYEEARNFSEGFAAVKEENGKWGFLAVDGYNAAYASTQSVLVDGSPVEFQCYALKDQSGNDINYIKLRDVASVLNGTAVQFNVGWDGAVNIETGKGYTPNGSEMSTPFSGNRSYEKATAETRIDGVAANLSAIVLKDDAGGAYTYYKLRDLGEALGFRVDWSAEKGIFIETK